MKTKKMKVVAVIAILLLAASCSFDSGINKAKFTGLKGAADELKASIAAGASYQQFSERVQRFSVLIAESKDKMKNRDEKDLLNAYSDLLSMYRDGLLLWKYKLEFAPFDFVPKGRIYVGQDVEPIVFKYNFQAESHLYQPTQQRWKSIPENSIQIIWKNTDSQMKIIENMTNY